MTQEIGYGLVPVDAFDRRYRELEAGRICTVLAANSDQVDRVVCGIGVTIKGEISSEDRTGKCKTCRNRKTQF